jgi:ATP-dependent Clp protease ATP-binding subunit ClpX
VYICDECVGLCNEILAADPGPRTATMRWEDTLDDEELLHHLGQVAAASMQMDDSLQIWVDTLRQRRVTWARIGEALGMTRQSAWERFSGEE